MLEKTITRPTVQTTSLNLGGFLSAVLSATLLGLTPILGKLAIHSGITPFSVVALRTILATLLMAFTLLFTKRSSFYIYPAGLLGCALAGILNGTGSLFYYQALAQINANVGQLIFMTYPIFVTIWLVFDHYLPSPLSIFRLGLIAGGIFLLILGIQPSLHFRGVLFMFVAAACYGLHLPINQRVLFEMPAPTVTFYTLLFMSLVVTPFSFFDDRFLALTNLSVFLPALLPVLALALVTFLSRLTLFVGVKKIGGIQTALLGVIELLITLLFSWLWLHETLNLMQWSGVFLILLSIALITFEKPLHRKSSRNSWLHWLQPHPTATNQQNPPRLD